MPPFAVLDSVTHMKTEHRGVALYAASHGGVFAGAYAAKAGTGAVILNDAGIGRERAGLAGVDLLDTLGVPAATLSHRSCRIGDGADGLARGVVSFANGRSTALGIAVGMSCREALTVLAGKSLAPAAAPDPRLLAEARFEVADLSGGGIRVFGLDSNGLVTAADAGHVVVTGSHGGLLGGNAATAVKHPVLAAVYNDAGFGSDDAGISRLPVLEARGIAAACVSVFSARIGDARSTLDDGYVSALNATAVRMGGAIGQSCRTFVRTIVANAGRRS